MSNQKSEELINEPLQGFQVLKLHYSADPEKDEEWAKKAKQEYPTELWEREFELKPVGHAGNYPVFGDYRKSLHENVKLVYNPSINKTIIRGWDFGKVHPCVEFLQLDGLKKNFIGECFGSNIQLPQFTQQVLEYSLLNFPGARFLDWCDATGKNERDNGFPSVKILRDYGLHPKWRMQEIEEGILYIQKGLVQYVDGRPQIMFNPKFCSQLVKALRGGYCRDKHGKVIKDGEHDHAPDAARYAVSGIITGLSSHYKDQMDKIKSYRYKPSNPITGY